MSIFLAFIEGLIISLFSILFKFYKCNISNQKSEYNIVNFDNGTKLVISNNITNNVRKKVLIYLQGGFYFSTGKEYLEEITDLFMKNNIIIVGIIYKIDAFTVDFEQLCNMIDKLFYWIYLNIENYGGNKDELYAIGESSGGHLLNYLIFSDILEKKNIFNYSLLKKIILVAPPFNLEKTKQLYPWIPENLYQFFFKNNPRKYSLKKNLKDNKIKIQENFKSNLLIIHCINDSVIDIHHTIKYIKYLDKMNIKYEYKAIFGTHISLSTTKLIDKNIPNIIIRYIKD